MILKEKIISVTPSININAIEQISFFRFDDNTIGIRVFTKCGYERVFREVKQNEYNNKNK